MKHIKGQYDPRKRRTRTTAYAETVSCIQECPRGALEKSLSQGLPEHRRFLLESPYVHHYLEAGRGREGAVSGAGYKGPFTGTGFDSMWTDMSEIVSPDRDGIHGREYISTSVELGRKLNHLAFDANGQLASKIFDTVAVPLSHSLRYPGG